MAWGRFSHFLPSMIVDRRERVPKKASLTLGHRLTPTVDRRLAEAAKQMLDNEAFEGVFDRLRAAAMDNFASSQDADTTARDHAYRKIRVLDDIKAEIQAIADELKLHPTHDADDKYIGP